MLVKSLRTPLVVKVLDMSGMGEVVVGYDDYVEGLVYLNFVDFDDETVWTEYKGEKTSEESHRDYNVGDSNYSEMKIQPYDIFEAFPNLNYWECDIIKRVLRDKKSDSRLLDYQKIKHIAEYLIEREENNAS